MKQINVELVFGYVDNQELLSLKVDEDYTIEQIITKSGILGKFPEIDLKEMKVGVFGKKSKLENTIHDGDRVEIYRKLIADPKEARKKRAADKKAK